MLFDLIIGEEYKLWSSSLCSFLQQPSELLLLKFHLNSAVTSSVGWKYPCYTVHECRVWERDVRNTGIIKFQSCLHQLLLSLN
jgi:hypothetical protein